MSSKERRRKGKSNGCTLSLYINFWYFGSPILKSALASDLTNYLLIKKIICSLVHPLEILVNSCLGLVKPNSGHYLAKKKDCPSFWKLHWTLDLKTEALWRVLDMDDITLLKGTVLGFILVRKDFWEHLKGHDWDVSFKEKQVGGKTRFSVECLCQLEFLHFCMACWLNYAHLDMVWKNPFSLHNTLMMS